MSRTLTLSLVAALLCGCTAYPRVDPFAGRQTVMAPATGTAGPVVGSETAEPPPRSYYENMTRPSTADGAAAPPRGAVTSPVGTGAPADNAPRPEAGAPAGRDPYAPVGGFEFRGTSSSSESPAAGFRPPPRASRYGDEADSAGAAATSSTSRPVRALGPEDAPIRREPWPGRTGDTAPVDAAPRVDEGAAAPQSPSASRTAVNPRYASVRRRINDITDLPPVRESSSSQMRYGKAQPASFTRPAAGAQSRRAVLSSKSMASYGYDPDYAWLKGRLEYSQISKRWKLRYIPIGDATDEFGGSVVLGDPEKLEGFQAGDFVTVRGGVGERDAERLGFAPTYRVDQVSPAQ